jgi:hypothetical protein
VPFGVKVEVEVSVKDGVLVGVVVGVGVGVGGQMASRITPVARINSNPVTIDKVILKILIDRSLLKIIH